MGLHIGGDQAQCIPHHWIVLECVLVEHVDELTSTMTSLFEHLVHLGHSIKVHTLSQFFFSLTTHPLTQHGSNVCRGLQTLQLCWVNAALKGHDLAVLIPHRQQRFTCSVEVHVLGQTLHSGGLSDTARCWEAHSKTRAHVHTTCSHAGVLDDALVERRLTHRGEVVGHLGLLEQCGAGVVRHLGIALLAQVGLITHIPNHQGSTCCPV